MNEIKSKSIKFSGKFAMEAVLTKCFICDVACVAHEKYLGINIARTLTLPMSSILDKCLRAQIDVDKEIFCAECAKKIEEYDQVVQLSLQIETELYELFHKKETESYLVDVEVIGETEKIPHKYLVDEINDDDTIDDGMVVEYLDETDSHLNESISDHPDDNNQLISESLKSESTTDIDSPSPQQRRSKRHLNSIATNKVYKCKKCDFNTVEYDEYQEHRNEHETDERFVCDICGRSYKSKSALTNHIGVHSNKSPFECQLCNKTFTQRGALVRHMPIHTGEKPHQVIFN